MYCYTYREIKKQLSKNMSQLFKGYLFKNLLMIIKKIFFIKT